MQKYCAYGAVDKIERYGPGGEIVYLASDADARIAQLERALHDLYAAYSREDGVEMKRIYRAAVGKEAAQDEDCRACGYANGVHHDKCTANLDPNNCE